MDMRKISFLFIMAVAVVVVMAIHLFGVFL